MLVSEHCHGHMLNFVGCTDSQNKTSCKRSPSSGENATLGYGRGVRIFIARRGTRSEASPAGAWQRNCQNSKRCVFLRITLPAVIDICLIFHRPLTDGRISLVTE